MIDGCIREWEEPDILRLQTAFEPIVAHKIWPLVTAAVKDVHTGKDIQPTKQLFLVFPANAQTQKNGGTQ